MVRFHLSAKRPGSSQKNKRLVAAVQSWCNLRRHLAWLTLVSISRLCFWVTQLILLTNNSSCSTLRVSQRERDHYKPERPLRANFTFDYRPSAGFTLNQRELWNRGSAVSTEKQQKKQNSVSSSPVAPVWNMHFLSTGFLPRELSHSARSVIWPTEPNFTAELEVCRSFKCLTSLSWYRRKHFICFMINDQWFAWCSVLSGGKYISSSTVSDRYLEVLVLTREFPFCSFTLHFRGKNCSFYIYGTASYELPFKIKILCKSQWFSA